MNRYTVSHLSYLFMLGRGKDRPWFSYIQVFFRLPIWPYAHLFWNVFNWFALVLLLFADFTRAPISTSVALFWSWPAEVVAEPFCCPLNLQIRGAKRAPVTPFGSSYDPVVFSLFWKWKVLSHSLLFCLFYLNQVSSVAVTPVYHSVQ